VTNRAPGRVLLAWRRAQPVLSAHRDSPVPSRARRLSTDPVLAPLRAARGYRAGLGRNWAFDSASAYYRIPAATPANPDGDLAPPHGACGRGQFNPGRGLRMQRRAARRSAAVTRTDLERTAADLPDPISTPSATRRILPSRQTFSCCACVTGRYRGDAVETWARPSAIPYDADSGWSRPHLRLDTSVCAPSCPLRGIDYTV